MYHTLFSADDFGSPWAAGADARFRVKIGRVDFDARFLGGFDFTSAKSISTISLFAGTPADPPILLGDPSDNGMVSKTQFNSAELNVSYDFNGRFTGFAGGRQPVGEK